MFALGCIQSLRCHTGYCPTGVTTQDPLRQRALAVEDKGQRVYNFHRNTLHALGELTGAAGLTHPGQFEPRHIVRRVSPHEIRLVCQSLQVPETWGAAEQSQGTRGLRILLAAGVEQHL